MTTPKRSGRNSIYGLLGFVIPTLVLLAAYPILINHLGAEIVGVYLLATGLSGAWMFFDFGVNAATLKFVAEDIAAGHQRAAAKVIVTSLAFYGAIGVIGALAIWFLAPWLSDIFSIEEDMRSDAEWAFRIAGVRFAAFFLTMVLISLFKGLHRFEYSMVILSTLQAITFGGAILGVLAADAGLVGISLIGMTANLIILILSLILAFRLSALNGIFLTRARPSIATFRRIFSYGAFMGLNGIAWTLTHMVQNALVSAILGPGAVTVFSIAAMVSQRANQAYAALFEFIVPTVSAMTGDLNDETLRRQAERRLRRLYLLSFSGATLLALASAALLYFIAPFIIHLWLNSEIDEEVIQIVRLFCPAIAAYGIIVPGYHMLNGLGRPHLNTIFRLATPALLYAVLGGLWIDGLVLEEFAIAQSAALVIVALGFTAFMEITVWRGWIRKNKIMAKVKTDSATEITNG